MKGKIKVGIAGAGGYVGGTVFSILQHHPDVEIEWISSEPSHDGKNLKEIFPHLFDFDYTFLPLEEALKKKVDVVFTALPHSVPMKFAKKILESGARLIDLSADFRFKSFRVFSQWYGVEHTCPDLLQEAVYGLPEINREKISKARLIANPGCYPTASILGIYPLLKERLAEYPVIVDAKSGISGAGRGLSLRTHFAEVSEGVVPYGIFSHRHAPEIEEKLKEVDENAEVIFTPHLIPMIRGIEATIYAKLKKEVKRETLVNLYNETYKEEPFIRISESVPSTKYVSGTNLCAIWVGIKGRNVIVVSCIDNLIKGASGQAVQNMNIMFGLDEKRGLETIALYP